MYFLIAVVGLLALGMYLIAYTSFAEAFEHGGSIKKTEPDRKFVARGYRNQALAVALTFTALGLAFSFGVYLLIK